MQNFTFWNPTKIIFGTETIPQIGEETRQFGQKVLLVYGKSSIKKSGIYDTVLASLQEAGIEVVEHSGVKSNPVLSHVKAGIDLAKQQQIDVIVAVGGGSVIDEAKAIAVGAKTEHDVWEYYLGVKEVEAALPVLDVLTIAATGSEMNFVSVVTKEETQQKFNLRSPFVFPKVSILDPTVTFSVPKTYSAYGAVDAISHTIEGYFNGADPWTPIQDRYVEGLILSIMESADRIMDNAEDYQGRATMMWAATLALNGLPVAGIGATKSPNHLIAHSLGAMYDIAHGAALSIVIPGWMTYASQKSPRKFAQFAQRIFDIRGETPEKQAEKGIANLKTWFHKIGAPVSLAEGNIPEEDIEKIAENTQSLARKWNIADEYTPETVEHILRLCC